MATIILPSGERCDAECLQDLGVDKLVVPESFWRKMVAIFLSCGNDLFPLILPEISLAGFPIIPEVSSDG